MGDKFTTITSPPRCASISMHGDCWFVDRSQVAPIALPDDKPAVRGHRSEAMGLATSPTTHYYSRRATILVAQPIGFRYIDTRRRGTGYETIMSQAWFDRVNVKDKAVSVAS